MELEPAVKLNPSISFDRTVSLMVYLLYLTIFFTGVIGPLIGFIIAVVQSKAPLSELGTPHIALQNKLFKRLFVFGGLGFLMVMFVFLMMSIFELDSAGGYLLIPGLLILLPTVIWFVVKSIIGFSRLIGYQKV